MDVKVNKIPFSDMESWYSEPDGSLHHNSGRFFSIVGIDVTTDYGDAPHWRQPIILQPEVGYLGILTKEMDGVLYCNKSGKIILPMFTVNEENKICNIKKCST